MSERPTGATESAGEGVATPRHHDSGVLRSVSLLSSEPFDTRGNERTGSGNELVDAGLVENRKRKEPDSDGLYSYYRAASLGKGILEHGVRERMRREWDALEEHS